MKRLLVIAAASGLAACSIVHPHHSGNPYEKPLFIARYLNPSNPQDQQLQRTIDALRANPKSAVLHNTLGALLSAKGFPKDAEREFERAVDADSRYFPAWYNLGLMREARGEYLGARHAFSRTVHYKPGHAAALFQLGLMEEKRRNFDQAIEYYAKAFRINHALLDVRVNPRIVDSELVHLALLRAYTNEHMRESLTFQGTPAPWEGGRALLPPDVQSPQAASPQATSPQATSPQAPSLQAPSPQATPQQIVPPAPPVTEQGIQKPPPPITHT